MASKPPPHIVRNIPPERRLYIEGLLAACTPHSIVAREIARKFGIKPPGAMRWIRGVYALWALEAEPIVRDDRRNQMRAAFSDFYQKALLSRAWNAAGLALDRLAKLDGLYAPERVDVGFGIPGERVEPSRVRGRIRELLARNVQAASLATAPDGGALQ